MSQPALMRSLSDRETRLLSALAAAGRSVFTIDEARRTPGANDADVAKLLYRLTAKRWVQRLEQLGDVSTIGIRGPASLVDGENTPPGGRQRTQQAGLTVA